MGGLEYGVLARVRSTLKSSSHSYFPPPLSLAASAASGSNSHPAYAQSQGASMAVEVQRRLSVRYERQAAFSESGFSGFSCRFDDGWCVQTAVVMIREFSRIGR